MKSPAKRKSSMKSWLMMLLALLTLTILLTGCGTPGSNKVPCPAPPLVEYSTEFNNALSDQIRSICSDPKYKETCRALRDAYLLREQIRSCYEK